MRDPSDLALLPLAIVAGVLIGLAVVATVYWVVVRELALAVWRLVRGRR